MIDERLHAAIESDDPAALPNLLRAEPSLRDQYLDLLILEGHLTFEIGTAPTVVRSQRSEVRDQRLALDNSKSKIENRKSKIFFSLAAALLLTAAAVAVYVFVINPKSEISNPESAAPVATLIDATGDVFAGDDIAYPGSEIPARTVSIPSGSAEFLLTNRVGIRLVGTASLTIHSNMSATLTSGSAEFRCPPNAVGYTVRLPDGSKIIDLGTAFRVEIDDAGRVELRVSEGKVQWVGAEGAESATFTANQTAWIADGHLDRRSYVDRIVEQAPLAYWRFDESEGKVAAAVRGAPATLTDSVTPGVAGPRLGGFGPSNTGYRLTGTPVDLPLGKAMNATSGSVSFWLAPTPGGHGKLYYGSDVRDGDGGGGANELHLDLNGDGGINLFIRAGRKGQDVYFGSTGTYSDDRWHHVAATWDKTQTVIYIDGGALAGGETVTGPASAGRFVFSAVHRFGAPGKVDAGRHFAGRVDELAIWNKPLTARQVADQYRAARATAPVDSTEPLTPASETADR